MTDFLKTHPFVSLDDYMWKMNPCLIKLMTVDNTRVHYLSEKEKKRKGAVIVNDAEALVNDFGFPILSREMLTSQQDGNDNK